MADQPTTEIVPATTATPIRTTDAFLQPAAKVYEIKEAFDAYQELCRRLLDDSDYQRIGNKDFKKKSAWRKLGAAYNISDEIVSKHYERAENGRIVMAEVVVRVTAPNGRQGEGLGICDLWEKCCNPELCRNTSKWHTHCSRDCDGARHFSNSQHDLPATAHTRAKNRALSDLIAAGEVSAEEITNADHMQEPPQPRSFRERLKELPEAAQDAFPQWLASAGFPKVPKDWNAEQARACEKWLTNAEAGTIETAVGTPEAAETPVEPSEPDHAPEAADVASGPSDEAVAEAVGDDAVEAEIARVRGLKPAEVKAELEARGLELDGNADAQRKRLVLAVLREQMAAKQGGADSAVER